MTRKDYGLMLCLVTLSALIGGSLTSWLVSGEAVAEGSVPTAKVLQTERLQIFDANGQVRIELSAQPRGTASRGRSSSTTRTVTNGPYRAKASSVTRKET